MSPPATERLERVDTPLPTNHSWAESYKCDASLAWDDIVHHGHNRTLSVFGIMPSSPDRESRKRSAGVLDEGSEPESVKRLKVVHSVELGRFARLGGPDLSDLRGYGLSIPSRTRSRSWRQSDSTSRTGPFNADFRRKLEDCSIFLPRSSLPKTQNLKELKRFTQDYETSIAPVAYEQLEYLVDEFAAYYSAGDEIYALDAIVEDGPAAKPSLFDGERDEDVLDGFKTRSTITSSLWQDRAQ
ncbi:uncharacterized protein AB675_1413 [Cyphellophora attinorum]|uniref:Uncharacterized protein n=1 Tax=Cyphellophora attinorum TaxID=1664694 RepID=A0A0N0NH99_9EURO|nr:uncharacterized protein AB675_1413 [Phialophora attinorum]KPI34441.1 hypothetical protein AB675_1413 [Phialophora attinorum]